MNITKKISLLLIGAALSIPAFSMEEDKTQSLFSELKKTDLYKNIEENKEYLTYEVVKSNTNTLDYFVKLAPGVQGMILSLLTPDQVINLAFSLVNKMNDSKNNIELLKLIKTFRYTAQRLEYLVYQNNCIKNIRVINTVSKALHLTYKTPEEKLQVSKTWTSDLLQKLSKASDKKIFINSYTQHEKNFLPLLSLMFDEVIKSLKLKKSTSEIKELFKSLNFIFGEIKKSFQNEDNCFSYIASQCSTEKDRIFDYLGTFDKKPLRPYLEEILNELHQFNNRPAA